MLDIIIAIIGFLVVLIPLIAIHEYGHFWAARMVGIQVEVFSIGFGNEIFAFTDRKNTRWRLAAIPFGGYVKMSGEHDITGRVSLDDRSSLQPGDFLYASVLQRMFVVAAGPIANFLLAIVVFAVLFVSVGKVISPAQVDVVSPDSAADQAGIIAGDQITAVNGKAVDEFVDVQLWVVQNPGREITLTLLRDGREIQTQVTPTSTIDPNSCVERGILGIASQSFELRTYNPLSALVVATEETYDMVNLILSALGRIVTGQINQGEVGGPIKIAEVSGTAFKNGIISVLIWTALLSINLGLLNLLPIPVLDGGHLVFFAIEGVTGRRLAPVLQEWVMKFGFALLIGIFIVVTFFDIRGWLFPVC